MSKKRIKNHFEKINEILNQVQDDMMCQKKKNEILNHSLKQERTKKRSVQDDIQKYVEKIGVIYEN